MVFKNNSLSVCNTQFYCHIWTHPKIAIRINTCKCKNFMTSIDIYEYIYVGAYIYHLHAGLNKIERFSYN